MYRAIALLSEGSADPINIMPVQLLRSQLTVTVALLTANNPTQAEVSIDQRHEAKLSFLNRGE